MHYQIDLLKLHQGGRVFAHIKRFVAQIQIGLVIVGSQGETTLSDSLMTIPDRSRFRKYLSVSQRPVPIDSREIPP